MKPCLPVETHFYQRLLALDENEANDIADAYLKEKPVGSFYDSVLIPALALAEKDRHLNSLEPRTAAFITQTAHDLIDELCDRPVRTKALLTRSSQDVADGLTEEEQSERLWPRNKLHCTG